MAALIFALLWCIIVLFVFYRKEVYLFFNGGAAVASGAYAPSGKPSGKSLSISKDTGLGTVGSGLTDDLMGKSRMPEGMTKLNMNEIAFVADAGDETRPGLLSEVLQQVKEVFAVLAKEGGNKRDFLKLMAGVKVAYPELLGSPFISRINGFIAAQASFSINAEELDRLWV